MKTTLLLILALVAPFASGAPAVDANVAADDAEETCTGPRDHYEGSWSDPNGTFSYDSVYYDENCATAQSDARASVDADGERVAGVEAGERGEEWRQGSAHAWERHDTTCDGAPCDRTRTQRSQYEYATGTTRRGLFVDALGHEASAESSRCARTRSHWQDDVSTHDRVTGASTSDSQHSTYSESECEKGLWIAADDEDVTGARAYGCREAESSWDYEWNGRRWGNESHESCWSAREERVEVGGTGILLDVGYWQGNWTSCSASSTNPGGSCWNSNGTGGHATIRTFGAAGDRWLLHQERWIDYVRILP